jgi:hypothetical protein
LRLGLHLLAQPRLRVERPSLPPDQHLAQPQPRAPVVLARHVQRAGLHLAAGVLQLAQRRFAQFADAGLQRQVRPDAAQPADALARRAGDRIVGARIGQGLRQRQRRASSQPGIVHSSRATSSPCAHRSFGAELLEEHVSAGTPARGRARAASRRRC